MLASVKMEIKDGLLRFPEQLKEPFLATGDLLLWDGRRVSAEEIWYFLTEEAPRSYPYLYDAHNVVALKRSVPPQVELLSELKFHYLQQTLLLRTEAKRKDGWALTLVGGGPLLDLYFGAHAIPMQDGHMGALNMMTAVKGKGAREYSAVMETVADDGTSRVSSDVCRQMRTHSAIRRRMVPVDLLAPYTVMRCTQMVPLVEWQRTGRMDLPKRIIDCTWNHDPSKPWKVKYLAQSQREAVKMIDQQTGRHTTDEDLRAAIVQMNSLRSAGRDLMRLWWSAPLPPTSHRLRSEWESTGFDACGGGDPAALTQVFQEITREIKEMIEHGIKGAGVSDHPVRLWRCGSCVSLPVIPIEERGGVVLEHDDHWGAMVVEVDEAGDPYENIARAIMSNPYEQSAEKRALWTVEEARKARADGIIFAFHWGCNFQGAVSRIVCDVAKAAGMPAISLDVQYPANMDTLGSAHTTEVINNRISAFVEMLGGVSVTR